MTRAVLFDLDGTLVELAVDIEAARAEIARDCGWAVPLRPILERIDELAAANPELRHKARRVLDRYELQADATALPEACELLQYLREHNIPAGIVTNNGRACVESALSRAGLDPAQFRVVVTRDDVVEPKPGPAGLVHAARELLPEGGELWWVGDSERDRAAGNAAACRLDDVTLHIVGPELARLLAQLAVAQ